MMKTLHFLIKKGVYCSWCAELMRKTLNQHFKMKKISIDISRERLHLVPDGKINPEEVIDLLRKRGFCITVERN